MGSIPGGIDGIEAVFDDASLVADNPSAPAHAARSRRRCCWG